MSRQLRAQFGPPYIDHTTFYIQLEDLSAFFPTFFGRAICSEPERIVVLGTAAHFQEKGAGDVRPALMANAWYRDLKMSFKVDARGANQRMGARVRCLCDYLNRMIDGPSKFPVGIGSIDGGTRVVGGCDGVRPRHRQIESSC